MHIDFINKIFFFSCTRTMRVAAKLGVKAEVIFQAFTEKSDILNGYIVPEYESLHTQSREYIVDELLFVMREKGVKV